LILAICSAYSFAGEPPAANGGIRVLSWNISEDAFVSEQEEFQSLLLWADPEVVLLDEVAPSASEEELMKSLVVLHSPNNETWTINIGESGGRQRCVIASRATQETLPEFSTIIPYPDADRQYLLEHMSKGDNAYNAYRLDVGIPVNGAIIIAGNKRLLTVITDLQCCGDEQNSWEEYRRQVEARVIRRLIREVLQRTSVDGILIAGDFNIVNGPRPLIILSGPYLPNHAGLIAADLYHPDGATFWTWDGRGTPFRSSTLDYQLYDPLGLVMRTGFVLDTERLPPETLERYGLESGTVGRTGEHRPLLVEYGWK